MLIATITVLLMYFGGGDGFSFQIFEKAMKQSIQDKKHRKELTAEVDRAEKAMKTFRKDMKNMTNEFKKATTRYDATRSELDQLLDRIDNRRMAATREMLDARFALRDKMTEEQWNITYELAVEEAHKDKK